VQELIATVNVAFLAWAVTLVGSKQCRALPDYTEDVRRLAEVVEAAEAPLQRRGAAVVYVVPSSGE